MVTLWGAANATLDPNLLELQTLRQAAEREVSWLVLVVAAVVFWFVLLGELWHARRVLQLSQLAFGPRDFGRYLAGFQAVVRVLAMTLLAWSFMLLLCWPVKSHQSSSNVSPNEYRHLVLVLDVSPSMQLKDAGPSGSQTRAQRAADVLQSFFEPVAAEKYKTTIVAFYTEAKPVVLDSADREVIRNILTDLPMRHAFKSGETNIFAGLQKAAEIAKPWNPGSAILMLVTDGDTIPATGMPKMPASIGGNVVVGVGNPSVGQSISGHSSRQDSSTLRQVATRMQGHYHDANEKHLTTDLISQIDERATNRLEGGYTLREYALLGLGVGGGLWCGLLLFLGCVGTGWQPGIDPRRAVMVRPNGQSP